MCLKAAVAQVNINPAYKLSELKYSLNKVKCKGIIMSEKYKSQNYIQMIRTLCPELDICKPGNLNSIKVPSLKNVIVASQQNYKYAYQISILNKNTFFLIILFKWML